MLVDVPAIAGGFAFEGIKRTSRHDLTPFVCVRDRRPQAEVSLDKCARKHPSAFRTTNAQVAAQVTVCPGKNIAFPALVDQVNNRHCHSPSLVAPSHFPNTPRKASYIENCLPCENVIEPSHGCISCGGAHPARCQATSPPMPALRGRPSPRIRQAFPPLCHGVG